MNDLTNPDILAALEIAPVEWIDGLDGLPRHLGVLEDYEPKVLEDELAVYRQNIPHTWDFDHKATPADLDHALVYWLFTWLPSEVRPDDRKSAALELEQRGDTKGWQLTVVVSAVELFTVTGESPLLAVAAAVVKVGKPEEASVHIAGGVKACQCGCTAIRHHLLDNGSVEIQCADCHAARPDVIPGPQDPPRSKKRNRWA